MLKPRITKYHARRLAEDAVAREAEQRLTEQHLALWRQRGFARYEMFPQADEWEPIVGFVPDPEWFYEYGFMLVEDNRTVLACRALVDRHEAEPSVRLDWYPTRIDPRKRPD